MDSIRKTTTREGYLYEGKECMILQTPGTLINIDTWIYDVLKPFEGKHVELNLTIEVKVK